MASLWGLLPQAAVTFWALPTWTKVKVSVLFLSVVALAWFAALGARVWATYYELEDEYAINKKQVAKCDKDPEEQELHPVRCAQARRDTRQSLWHNAVRDAWKHSYACGGSPCIDVLFGSDSTFAGVTLRGAFVGAVLMALVLFGITVRAALRRVDGWFKARQTAKYSRYEALPMLPLEASVHDASGVFYNDAAALPRRKKPITTD